MRLEDRSAIVTGAASGTGRDIAMLFAREGAKVATAARSDMFEKVRAIALAAGDLAPEANCRLCEMETLFNAKSMGAGAGQNAHR